MSSIALPGSVVNSLNQESGRAGKAGGIHRETEREQQVKGKDSLKDDFMKIFLTQMLKQNPMKPNDSSMMMQQMGQLTALQSTEDLQKSVQLLTDNLGKSQLLAAAQLVGRHVQIPSDRAPLEIGNVGEDAKGSLKGSVLLTAPTSEITITIKDAHGLEVAKIKKGDAANGVMDFEWDGMIERNGERTLGTDEYYLVSASGVINGAHTALMTNGSFAVNSVTMDPASKRTILNLEGAGGVDMGSLIKIT